MRPHIFRPVRHDRDIIGDFSQKTPEFMFSKEDIEFVIGNKWEQAYARMIDDEYYLFPAKWLISTGKWVAYKTDSWYKTPLSSQCNGCHTTGFNQKNHEFSEFGVGCGACHGTGSKHVTRKTQRQNLLCLSCHSKTTAMQSDIVVSVKSSVCGLHHGRGNRESIDRAGLQASFRFSLDYKPGQNIPKDYKPVTAILGKSAQHWRGMGLSRNRHQEFADFSVSGHRNAPGLLKENSPSREKLHDGCLQCHSADYIFAKDTKKPTLENAKEGSTCVICHEPRGLDRLFPSLNADAHRCGSCHAQAFSSRASRSGSRPHIPPSIKTFPVPTATCPISLNPAQPTRYVPMPSRLSRRPRPDSSTCPIPARMAAAMKTNPSTGRYGNLNTIIQTGRLNDGC